MSESEHSIKYSSCLTFVSRHSGWARRNARMTPKPSIDSQYLRIYVTLARTLNMALAAKELHMTASGVSHCLKSLEEDLGCSLFSRSSRKFEITDIGRELLSDSEQILNKMQEIRGKIGSWNDWRQGQLLIGAEQSSFQALIAPTLREFRESFPEYTIKIDSCCSAQAIERVREGKLDLAVVIAPASSPPDIIFELIGEDELQFVVNALHPWAIKRKVVREEISNRHMILPRHGDYTRTLIEGYFRREKIRIQTCIELADEQAVKEFVRLDLGIAILPRWMLADELNDGSLVALPLGRRRLKRRWGVLRALSRKSNLSEYLFSSISKSIFRTLIQSTGTGIL
ncbi:MAG: LysR family transcriptional regulator [Chthoniobacteraceae bacterium]|nr:LysR family transcriptional regulator [Chthoniobacteraceae bacterium]